MTDPIVPSALTSVTTVMALTWKRLVRGRSLWVAGLIVILPVAFAAVLQNLGRSSDRMINDLLTFEQLLLAVLPAMLIASSIGEDIEDRTTTYLWSRPVARWVVLIGKLGTLIPVIVVLSVANWYAAMALGTGRAPSAGSCVALGAGAIALCFVSTGIATLAPRHGMALTICYMLFFDLPIGMLPLSLRTLSVTYQQRTLIDLLEGGAPSITDLGTTPSATVAATALAAIGGLWLAIALWRIRRLEA